MNRTFLFVVAISCLASVRGAGQEPNLDNDRPRRADGNPFTPPPQLGSPEWYGVTHEETSRDYIRRRAQEKAEARRARIEGMRWLGYSPLRPTVSSTPFFAHPPTWSAVPSYPYPGTGMYWYHPVNISPY